MGSGASRSVESLDTGKDVASATAILARRLTKAKDALSRGLLDRAREKSQSALHLCTKWGTPPNSLPDAVILDALHKSVWVLGHVAGGRAGDPSKGVVLRAMVVMADIAARHCGPESWQLADVWFALAEHASSMDSWPVAVNFGLKASELLLKLRGERHFVPNSAIAEIPWDAFGKEQYWTCGHIDCLNILAHAHTQLKERKEAQRYAARHLVLLEQVHGRGHPETIPGLQSCMAAACMLGEGDMRAAVAWSRHIVELRVRENKGSPYSPDVAAAYEAVALMFLCPGANFSPDMALRIAERAAQLRAGCLASSAPNEAVMASVEKVIKARQEGRKNTRGANVGGYVSMAPLDEETTELDKAADEALEAGGYGGVLGELAANTAAHAAAAGGGAAAAAGAAGAGGGGRGGCCRCRCSCGGGRRQRCQRSQWCQRYQRQRLAHCPEDHRAYRARQPLGCGRVSGPHANVHKQPV